MRRGGLLCLLALCGTSLLQSCLVVNAPQVETVKALAKSMFDKPVSEDIEQIAKWSARVGDEGRLVEVVEQDGFFVFVSNAGDAIAFDGWDVRSIIGFGGSDTRQIAVDDEQKRFRSASGLSSRRCEGWKLDPNAFPEDFTIWIQQCDGQTRANSIVVDRAGAISEISQAIDINGTRAVLKRM